MLTLRGAVAVATLVFAPITAWAQTEPVAGEAATAEAAAIVLTPAATTVEVPANTPILLEFTEALSSRTAQTGYMFGLRLAEPIVINGEVVVPAGLIGGGEVIDAHHSGMGGRQGVLTLSGRFIDIRGQRIRIRGMQVFSAGEDNTREAVNTTILVGGAVGATIGLLIQGGEVEIPVGARAQARTAIAFSAPAPSSPSEASPSEASIESSPDGMEPTQGDPQQ